MKRETAFVPLAQLDPVNISRRSSSARNRSVCRLFAILLIPMVVVVVSAGYGQQGESSRNPGDASEAADSFARPDVPNERTTLPFGEWDGNTYYNNWLTPLQIKVPAPWVRRDEHSHFVAFPDGEAVRNREQAVDLDQMERAYVFSIHTDTTTLLITFGLEIWSLKRLKTLDNLVALAEFDSKQRLGAKPGLLMGPKTSRSATEIDGRTYQVLDLDAVYHSHGVHNRTYFTQVGDHALSFGLSYSSPSLRQGTDRLMEKLVSFGASSQIRRKQ